MKKRVLSLVLAFVLSFSMMPMSAFAEETGTVTEQETQKGENSAEVSTTGEDTAEVSATGEDISSGNAVTKDAAVEAAQALINALPEEVTAENADELQAQLMAIDKALDALDEEQRAKLNMTRLENIQAALNGAVAVQDAGHTNHPVCGDVDCQEHDVLNEWKALSCDENGTLTIDGAEWKLNKERYYLETGNYYLAGDLNLNNRIVISGEVNLCLNGFSITQTEEYSVISYQTDTTTFSLCDCKKSGVIRGNASRSVVYVYETFNMYGGTISGGAVGVEWCDDGCFNMYGGEISDNTTGASRANYSYDIFIFNMYGGEICNNNGSGVKMEHLAKFNMYGGEICNNNGSGVYITRGHIPVISGGPAPTGDIEFNMSGGKITGNKTDMGSGVYMKCSSNYTAKVNMSGGEITGNNADTGGGVYVGSHSTFTMSGGEITGNNTATNGGGNVYVADGTFSVSDTAKIQNNWIDGVKTSEGVYEQGTGKKSNVYLPNNKKITIGELGLQTGASIGVTYGGTVNADTDATIATGANKGYSTDSITSDDGYRVWKVDDELRLTTANLDSHPICGKECTDGSHSIEVWKGISDPTKITSDGNYYLTSNVDLTSVWYCKYNVKLCLNGCTITGASAYAVIKVASGASLDITDCKDTAGKITHESDASGCGINVSGTLILWNGDITGNTNESSGGGVSVNANGSFTMNGGAITQNTAPNNGGGGVYVAPDGTFTMNSGSITGNMSASHGGGVYASGIFNMNGGTITGNNSKSTNANIRAGGVYVASNNKFTVSGAAKIIGNWRSGELSGSVYVQGANGTTGNVYLPSSVTFAVGEGLTEEAEIGVSKSPTYLPGVGKEVKIATNATNDQLDYTKIFQLDVDDPNYTVIRDDAGNLSIYNHQHNWTYVQGADPRTIMAVCDATGCPKPTGGWVTIDKPLHEVYGDSKNAEATLSVVEWQADAVTVSDIRYQQGGKILASAPTDAGTYTARITLGDATASVTYTIEKATPTANDFTFTAPSPTYNGEPKEATVAANKEGMGTIVAVTYYRDGIVVEKPTDAGTYTFKISVGEGENYKAASGLENPDWEFTIECNKNMPIVKFNDGTTYTYTGEQIQPTVTVTVGGKELVKDKDYTVTYGKNINVGDGTVIITAKGNYAFDKYTEYFTIEQAEQTLNFESSEIKKTFGDDPFTNALAKTSSYFGTITYSSNNTAVADVDENGKVTIHGAGTATITATAAATPNYNIGTATYELTVGKALIHLDGVPRAYNKTYDGTTDAEVGEVSFADKNGNKVLLTEGTGYTVKGTFSSPNVSISPQEVKVEVTLLEDCVKNYELEAATCEARATIFAKYISIVGASAKGREYKKGNTTVTIDSVDFDGVVTSLVKDTDYTVTGEMADADAGKDKVVNITVTLSGDAATNYNLSDTMPTTTVEISKATPVITAATWKTLMNNGIAVDISDWATFNNTDGAKLIYKLWDAIPEGVTLDENNMLKAENTVPDKSSFAIEVTAEATKNFEKPETQYITVQVVNKITVGVEVKGVPDTVTYGDPDFSLTADFDPKGTVPAEGDNGTWNWSSDDNNILKIQPSADGKTAKIHVKNAGTVMLTVTYTSDTYIGVANISITVNPKAITADMIGNIDAQEYTGKDIKPTPEVKDGTTKLTNDTDFTYSYSNNRNAGTATLTITGKGNYEGEVTKEFTISPKSIDGASIELANKSFAYTGSEQTVNITSVKLSDGTVLGTDDYVIKDNSNKATNAGEITLTIEGKGNYTGTATTTWAITKAVPKLADFDVVPDLSNELTYSGEEQIVNVTTKARGMGMITVRYNGSTEKPVNVGNYAITIDVADGSNYKAISGIEAGTLTIKKAAAPTLADVKVDHAYATTGNQTVSLAELVKSAKSYTPGEITGNTETEILSDINVTGDGVLQYTLTGKGAAGSTVTIPVTIASTNYEETTVNVVITIKQATPTGAPDYDFIHDSSKMLKDAGLDLINSSLNPKEGTLEWIDSNGKVLPGETKLEEGRKYIWRFTPDDPNYAVITGEVELYAPYRILDGADSTWTQSTDGTIAIRGNGDFEKFQSVKVDGVVVDAKNYTVAKGSTIITFKEDYLKTLSTGSHTFELVWTDGSAATKFTIAAKADNGDNNNSDNNNNDKNDDSDNDTVVIGNVSSGNNSVPAVIGAPKTGDASGIWMTLFAVSLAGLAAMLVRKKNNRE